MREQILYDKIMSVTLYRKTRKDGTTFKTIPPDTYTESKVNGRRVLGLGSFVKEEQEKSQIGTRFSQVGVIEFYQGNYRDILVDVVQVRGQYMEKYKRVYAHGPCFTYRTIDDMKKGVRPDGSPLQTGDRIRIIEDKSKWNVYAEGSLSEVYTEVMIPTQVLEINATDYGMKPDMSLSINLLPNQNCYGATLKIRNFNLDAIDIRTWDRMVITAGYRTGTKAVYDCPIFSSYLESPNPDGVTVFEGLTVGVAEDVLTDRFLTIDFRQEEMTLGKVIEDVAKGIAENIVVTMVMSSKYTNVKVNLAKQKVFAQNGAAVLNWLQEFVANAVQEMSKGETTAFLQLVDNNLTVIALNGENMSPEVMENIISLDMVTGATFVGTALNVVAPWNPALKPGDAFYMPPEFINGAKLPNTLKVDDYRNPYNLYRAITINVEFASTAATNKMTVLAVPAQWAGRLPDTKTTEMPADEYAKLLNEMYNKPTETIPVGELDKQTAEDLRTSKPKLKQGENLLNGHSDFLTQWPSWISMPVRAGECMSVAAERYLRRFSGGPQLTKGMGNERQYCYNEPLRDLQSDNNILAVTHYSNTGLEAQHLWWPLIMLGTYWRRQKDIEAGVNHNWSKIKPDDPDYVEAGAALYIPEFPNSWREGKSRFEAIKDVWKDAYLDYGRKYGSYSTEWRAMYYYLGGDEVLPDY